MKLIISLSGSHPNGLKYFQRPDYDLAIRTARRFRSYDTMVYMKPDQFLQLAADFRPKRDTISNLVSALKDGTQFEQIPYLRVSETDVAGVLQVEGHEGRHRSLSIKHIDPDCLMPVRVYADGLKWKDEGLLGKTITLIDEDEKGHTVKVRVEDV